MGRAFSFLTGAAIGALTMYYFDPDRGRGRRSVCEDQWAARGRPAVRYLDKAGRDLANRARGLAHEARHLVRGETPPEDGHRGQTFDILHEDLAPGTRLALAALGSGLFALGLTEDAPEACVLGTVGSALILPAVTGRGVASGFGLWEGRQRSPQQQPGQTAAQARATTERRPEAAPVM
jgi:hypothetical protein